MADVEPPTIHRDETVYLADLMPRDLNASSVLRFHVFERCTIVGPAVLAFGAEPNQLAGVYFAVPPPGDPGVMFWTTHAPGLPSLVGVIGVENCLFEQCHFQGVGFVDHTGYLRRQMGV